MEEVMVSPNKPPRRRPDADEDAVPVMRDPVMLRPWPAGPGGWCHLPCCPPITHLRLQFAQPRGSLLGKI
jgi:hypothetical protein